jgi:DNA repair protein RecO (recombination protein O)
MHHIYHTKGIILRSRNSGEAGKHYKIFTRELGMVTAKAAGVRKLSSKLRFVLQDFSFLDIDLVAGRNIFHLTTAVKTCDLENLTKKIEVFKTIHNIAGLLIRLMPESLPNEAMFDDLVSGLQMLENSKEDCANIEALIVLRIINHLGYMQSKNNFKNFTESPFRKSLVSLISKERKAIFAEINRALKETHL